MDLNELYEVVDLGITWPDYFQGFGVAYTKYEYSTVGNGESFNEALLDALESVAMCGTLDENDTLLNLIEATEKLTDEHDEKVTVSKYLAESVECTGECFAYTDDEDAECSCADNLDDYPQYYVGLRWNVPPTEYYGGKWSVFIDTKEKVCASFKAAFSWLKHARKHGYKAFLARFRD